MITIDFLINSETEHVIVRIKKKKLDKIIKNISKSTGLSKERAMRYWKNKMVRQSEINHNINNVDFQVL